MSIARKMNSHFLTAIAIAICFNFIAVAEYEEPDLPPDGGGSNEQKNDRKSQRRDCGQRRHPGAGCM